MDFNTWKEFYNWGFCTKEDLKQALEQEMLTQQQYDEILGIQEPVSTPTKGEGTAETKPVENTKTETQETKPTENATPVVNHTTQSQQPVVNQTPVAQSQETTTTPSTTPVQ